MIRRSHKFRTPLRVLCASAVLLAFAAPIAYHTYTTHQTAKILLTEHQAELQHRQTLDHTVSFAFNREVPLGTWLTEFTRQTDIPVELNSYYDLPLETVIYLDLPPLPAQEALETLGQLYEMDWYLRDDGVVVLNCDPAAEPKYPQLQPVPPDSPIAAVELRELIEEFREIPTEETEEPLEIYANALSTVQSHRRQLRTANLLRRLTRLPAQEQHLGRLGLPADHPAWSPVWLSGEAGQLQLLQAALARPINLHAVDMPVHEFVENLARQAEFPLVLQPWAAASAETPERVTCTLENVTLADAIAHSLGEHFCWSPRAGGRMLSLDRRDDADYGRSLTMFAYPVGDLVRSPNLQQSSEEMLALIDSMIAHEWKNEHTWAHRMVVGDGRWLVVSQRLDVHEQIAALLFALRQVNSGAQAHAVAQLYAPPRKVSAELELHLDTPQEFQFANADESDAFEKLCRQGRISFPPHEPEINNYRTGDIWCHLPARPLRENLEIWFAANGYEPQHLEHVLLRGSSAQPHIDDANQLVCEVFDLRPWLVAKNTSLDVSTLIEAVTVPDTWQNVGGNGSLEMFGDLLVVQCHPRFMPQVREFLAALRAHVTPTRERSWRGTVLTGEALNQPLDLSFPSAAELAREQVIANRNEEIKTKLQRIVSVSIQNKELGAALLDLARQYGLPMVLHSLPERFDPNVVDPFARAPRSSGENSHFVSHWAATDDLVSLEMRDRPLINVLQALLNQVDHRSDVLWKVRGGYLTLALPIEPEIDEPEFFLYSVDDLVAPRGELLPKQLIRTLAEALHEPDRVNYSGLGAGGPFGKGLYIDFHIGNLLWVSTIYDPESRMQVEETLRKLRSGELQPAPAEQGDGDFLLPEDFWSPLGGSVIPVVG